MPLPWTIRDLEPDDLVDLDWSGGSEHQHAVADALGQAYAGTVDLLVAALPNGRLVGLGAVDFRPDPVSGLLWMLAVHERFQSLGLGRALIGALEQRVAHRGRKVARLKVELDNPRAASLYLGLGYREVGAALDRWPVAGGLTYVAACRVLERSLPAGQTGSAH